MQQGQAAFQCSQVSNISGEAYKKITRRKGFCVKRHVLSLTKRLDPPGSCLSKCYFLQSFGRFEINSSLLQMGVKCSTKYVLWAKKDETNSANEN